MCSGPAKAAAVIASPPPPTAMMSGCIHPKLQATRVRRRQLLNIMRHTLASGIGQ